MAARIVSLLPSATEIVCCVGAGDRLVGVSHECDHPAEVVGLPVLTQARMAPAATSLGIHHAVQDAARDALAVYAVEGERLRALQPDLIVTQDLCDVCAVSFAEVCEAVQGWLGGDAEVVSLSPERLEDIWEDIRRTAAAIGCVDEGERALEGLLERVERVRAKAAKAGSRPSVVTVEWIEPAMLGGYWMAQLVDLAGGEPLGEGAGEKSRVWSREELEALEPEVVLIKPCGFDLARTREELHRLPEVLPWERWPAVQQGRVFVVDGNAYYNRPGPRIVDSLEILAACVHPTLFPDVRSRYPDAVWELSAGLEVRPWTGR